MRRWQADLVLGGIALIWGATFVMVKSALGAVGPATFIAWRFVIATGVMLLLFGRRMQALTRTEAAAGALLGVWLGLGYTLQTTGLQFTTTGKTGFITGLSVVIVPLLAALLFRQVPGWLALAGIVAATLGLGLLTLDASLRPQPGDLWVLGGAFMYAAHILTVSRLPDPHDVIRVAIVQMAAAALLVTAMAFAFEQPQIAGLPFKAWGAILFTGVVATALVFSTQVAVQRYTTATHAALIFSLESPFAAFFGWLWAGEILGGSELAGCALIMAGIVLSELGEAKQTPSG